MESETALLAALFADPDDMDRRLTLADWLVDQGDHARAKFIRLHCDLEKYGEQGEQTSRQLAAILQSDWYIQLGVPLYWEQVKGLYRTRLVQAYQQGRLLQDSMPKAQRLEEFVFPKEEGFLGAMLRQKLVHRAASQRQRKIGELDLAASAPEDVIGKVVAFEPDLSLFDGAAEAESDGYFDVNSMPPSEFWVLMVDDWGRATESKSYLLAFVPDWLYRQAVSGMRVDAACCINFASEIEAPFIQMLRWEGLLK
jgi:uncharacterized protein (TIGR02996 family)